MSVTINGQMLSTAQVSTLRVAVAHLSTLIADPEFRRDLGEIGDAYRDRLHEIERIMGVRT